MRISFINLILYTYIRDYLAYARRERCKQNSVSLASLPRVSVNHRALGVIGVSEPFHALSPRAARLVTRVRAFLQFAIYPDESMRLLLYQSERARALIKRILQFYIQESAGM